MSSQPDSAAKAPRLPFLPAKPSWWLLPLAQTCVRVDLSLNNRLIVDEKELDHLRKIPRGAGVILTPNHADEADPRVCLEVSRLSGRRFIFMGNREAFTEINGAAGWGLQRLGMFSVERGGHDTAAKEYSMKVVNSGKEVLVIFPEGEIFYLNDSLQPFHTGAVSIGMQALAQKRKQDPSFQTYIVPMSIKYRFLTPMKEVFEERVAQMEKDLSLTPTDQSIKERLMAIGAELLKRQARAHNIDAPDIKPDPDSVSDSAQDVRRAILAKVQQRHTAPLRTQAHTIDAAWQLEAHLREKLMNAPLVDQQRITGDLQELNEVAQLVSWKPQYIKDSTSEERIGEVIIKFERELYLIKRPKQLAKRECIVKIGEPIPLGDYMESYQNDPHNITQQLSERLRSTIQSFIDASA